MAADLTAPLRYKGIELDAEMRRKFAEGWPQNKEKFEKWWREDFLLVFPEDILDRFGE